MRILMSLPELYMWCAAHGVCLCCSRVGSEHVMPCPKTFPTDTRVWALILVFFVCVVFLPMQQWCNNIDEVLAVGLISWTSVLFFGCGDTGRASAGISALQRIECSPARADLPIVLPGCGAAAPAEWMLPTRWPSFRLGWTATRWCCRMAPPTSSSSAALSTAGTRLSREVGVYEVLAAHSHVSRELATVVPRLHCHGRLGTGNNIRVHALQLAIQYNEGFGVLLCNSCNAVNAVLDKAALQKAFEASIVACRLTVQPTSKTARRSTSSAQTPHLRRRLRGVGAAGLWPGAPWSHAGQGGRAGGRRGLGR